MPGRVEVREAIRIVRKDGWYQVRTRGSHRHYRHPTKPGKVTIPGHFKDRLHPKMWNTILKQGRNLEGGVVKRTYIVVFENGPHNLSTYVPDLPGCVSVGHTLDEARRNIKEAITFHIDLLLEHGDAIPEPSTSMQEALDLHNEGLVEIYEALGEKIPEPPAIAETVSVDASPDAIRREFGHLSHDRQDAAQDANPPRRVTA